MSTKARLDADRTAEPRTRLLSRAPGGCFQDGIATHYEGEDGQRVALAALTLPEAETLARRTTEPAPVPLGKSRSAVGWSEVTSQLHTAVRSALRAIGNDGCTREDAEGRVWIDESLYIEADVDCFYVMRDTAVPGFGHTDQCSPGFVRERGDAWAMRQAASALVREWVRERLDAWAQDGWEG